MLRSRRFALVAATAVLGLAAGACGDDTRSSSTTLPVIHISSSGSGAAEDAAPNAAGADRMMMPYGDITYLFDGTLPELPAGAIGWRLPAGAQPDPARIRAIAAALGVEGEVRALPADQGGGWMVGAADYSGASLMVSTDGMLSWWFNPAPSAGVGMGGCAAPVEITVTEEGETLPPDSAGGGSDSNVGSTGSDAVPPDTIVCEEPEPPTGVPGEDQALQQAKDLLATLGYDAGAFEYDVYADEWGASVSGMLLLGGERSPLTVSVGFGAEGAITWASGFLAQPEQVGEFPLVGADVGLERLNDDSGMWLWYGGPGMMARDAVTTDVAIAGTADEAPAGGELGAPEPMPVDSVLVDPVPVEEMPPMEIHLDAVRLGLTMVWDEDGTVWLLPAYLFTSTDGGEYAVPAVADEYLDLPDPVTVDTTPVDTVPVDTVVTGPTGDNPVDTTPVDVAPVDPAAAEILLGLAEDEAAKVAEEQGWTIRVVRADGVDFAVTADYVTNRVNVELTKGIVTAIVSIG